MSRVKESFSLVLGLAVAALLLGGCGAGTVQGGDDTGAVKIVVLPSVMTPPADVEVDAVEVAITGCTDVVVPLTQVNGEWHALIGHIPEGDCTFHAVAENEAGETLYEGESEGTITPGTTIFVEIVAQELYPPECYHNSAPVIDAVKVSSLTVGPGDWITVEVVAHDPDDGDTLTYAWSPADSFDDPAAAKTVFFVPTLVPDSGEHILTASVTDDHGATVSATVTLDVLGDADVTVKLNNWPHVYGVSANPFRIDVGDTVVLTADTEDEDDNPLTHRWSSDCGDYGTFTGGDTLNPTSFKLTALPPAGSCKFFVHVDDGEGGENHGSITIAAGPLPTAEGHVVIRSSAQSRTDIPSAGGGAQLFVEVFSESGVELSFEWGASSGTLTTLTNTWDDAIDIGSSTLWWTSPDPFMADATIWVFITDGEFGSWVFFTVKAT